MSVAENLLKMLKAAGLAGSQLLLSNLDYSIRKNATIPPPEAPDFRRGDYSVDFSLLVGN